MFFFLGGVVFQHGHSHRTLAIIGKLFRE